MLKLITKMCNGRRECRCFPHKKKKLGKILRSEDVGSKTSVDEKTPLKGNNSGIPYWEVGGRTVWSTRQWTKRLSAPLGGTGERGD